jgi:hypothetical protein
MHQCCAQRYEHMGARMIIQVWMATNLLDNIRVQDGPMPRPMNALFQHFRKPRLKLHLHTPGEPGNHEQFYWLVKYIGALKADVKQLAEEKEAFTFQLKQGEPLTDLEREVVELRHQVNMLRHRNARLEKQCAKWKHRNSRSQQADTPLDQAA